MTTKQYVILACVVALAVVWEFGNVLHAGFIFQDNRWQTANEAGKFPILTYSRFLMHWSWWLQARITPQPVWFHVVNLLLHVVVSVLVAVLASNIGFTTFGSVLTGVIFLLNPMQMETVAYIAGRTEIFAALGVVTAAILLSKRVSAGRIALAILALVFGFLGKESAIVGVVIIALVRREWLIAAVSMLVIGTLLVWVAPSMVEREQHINTLMWASTQSVAYVRILVTSVIQVGSSVDFDYDQITLSTRTLGVLTVLFMAWSALMVRNTMPLITVGILITLVVAIPRTVMITPMSNFNEHQFYLAMVGVSMVASDAIVRFTKGQVG